RLRTRNFFPRRGSLYRTRYCSDSPADPLSLRCRRRSDFPSANCETPMTRKPVRWAETRKRIFSPIRTKRPSPAPPLEQLGARIVPRVTYPATNTTTDSLAFSSLTNTGTLRGCLQAANASSDPNVVIDLVAGATYRLTLANFNPITLQ